MAAFAGLKFLMWKGSKQSYSALLRKIDVRMWEIKSASNGNTTGSREDETAASEKETSMKLCLLLHCKRKEHSCLLLSMECSCSMSVVWVHCCKMCSVMCLHRFLRKQGSKHTLYNVCDQDTAWKRGGNPSLKWRNTGRMSPRFCQTWFDMIDLMLVSPLPSLQHMQWKLISQLITCSENKLSLVKKVWHQIAQTDRSEKTFLFLLLTLYLPFAQCGGCMLWICVWRAQQSSAYNLYVLHQGLNRCIYSKSCPSVCFRHHYNVWSWHGVCSLVLVVCDFGGKRSYLTKYFIHVHATVCQ